MSVKQILPRELNGLPEPWGVTDDIKRSEAVQSLSIERETFEISLQVLEHTLRALPHLPEPATLPLPDQIGDAYGFVIHEIAGQIKVLDDLSESPFESCLASLTKQAPDVFAVEALAKAWIHSVCAAMSRSVLRWLGRHWQLFPRDLRSRLVHIASEAWMGIPEELAITLLTTVSTVAREDSLGLLADAEDHGGTPSIRSIAGRYREWTATRSDPGV